MKLILSPADAMINQPAQNAAWTGLVVIGGLVYGHRYDRQLIT